MRKLAILAILVPIWSFGDQIAVTKFKGINNNANSVIIDPSEAQDLLNVDVSVTGQSVKKRSGFGTYKALGTGQAVHGGAHFYDSTGNDVQIWGSSTSLYGVVADGTPTQLISSATLNSTWDCADSQAFAYCVNSTRNAYVKTNGATMTWYASPLGTMVEATPDRMVVAGVSGTPNTLYVSESNVFTNFTVGLNSTDPFNEVIASPGSKLTHIRWGCGKLLWWKDASFGYFDFDDQYVAQVKTVSDTIGTFDNTSAIDPGGSVWFRGQDGHTWKYDCSFLTKESIDITPNVQVSGKRTTNSWTQTSGSDFNGGYRIYTDTTTSPGDVGLLRLDDNFTSYPNIWETQAGTIQQSASIISMSTTTTASFSYAETASTMSFLPSGATIFMHINGKITQTSGFEKLAFGISGSLSPNGTEGCGIGLSMVNGGNPSLDAFFGNAEPPKSSSVVGTLYTISATNDANYHDIMVAIPPSGKMVLYVDGLVKASATRCVIPANPIAIISCGITGGYSGVQICQVDRVVITYSTGTYYSAVHNAPNLTSWNTFGAAYQDNGGIDSFFVRSSSNTFDIASSTPAWTAITPGAVPLISTGTNGVYFQMKDSFTVTMATQAPTLNDFTFNWYEGTASDQAYMFYFDNAIWESVPFGVGQSTNNYIFKYDLINQGWTLYNFGVGGMFTQNNRLYFGDTSAGNALNYGTSTSDNGTAINAFWKSKEFTGPDPFLQNQLSQIDVFAKKDQGTTLTSTYTTDTLTSTAYSISLSTSASIIQHRKLLPSGKLGYAFNLNLGDNSASSAWEVFGYRIGFTPQSYRPTPL